jgi:hypothetical protein
MVPNSQPCQSVAILAGKTTKIQVMNYTTPRLLLHVMDTWNNPITTMQFTGKDVNGKTHDIVDAAPRISMVVRDTSSSKGRPEATKCVPLRFPPATCSGPARR